jgi:hypothetical protein
VHKYQTGPVQHRQQLKIKTGKGSFSYDHDEVAEGDIVVKDEESKVEILPAREREPAI